MWKIGALLCTLGAMITAQQLPEFLKDDTQWAEKTLQTLTLREKIGQLFIVAAASKTVFEQPETLASSMITCPYNLDTAHVENMIQDYAIGGIIFLYKSDPCSQIALTEKFQKKSKIPLLIAQDSEWGLSMRLDLDPTKVVRYPRNMTLGALNDEQLLYELGNEIGKQCAALGIHMNLAPVIDVNNNPCNPVIHDRSFGDNPSHVARCGELFAQGLHDAGVLACAKHFPGHGDTSIDSHLDLPLIKHDQERLHAVELVPFKKLIMSNVDAIMNAHLALLAFDTRQQPSSMSYTIVTELLKNNLGFQGLVITDGLGMQAITKQYNPGELELEALLAGNDILLCPLDVPLAVTLIEKAIQEGRFSEYDLNHRVLKILKAKKWVLDKQKSHTVSEPIAYIIRPEAYDLQKKLYRNAITLVKNPSSILLNESLMKNSCIIQLGSLPENSFSNECKKYTSHTFIYKATMSDPELSTCLESVRGVDTIIIGIGQLNKYAKEKFGIATSTLHLLAELKKRGKKVIVVIFGTPYCIPLFNDAELIIEAYEDAVPAQQAVVDVLRGALLPVGKLPVVI